MKKRSANRDARKLGADKPVLIRSVAVSRSFGQRVWRSLHEVWSWLQLRQKTRMANKSLRVEENVSLGLKRFVAVVKVGDQRFLLGGGGNDVSLLASLAPDQHFQDVLHGKGVAVPSAVPPIKVRAPRTKRAEAGKCA